MKDRFGNKVIVGWPPHHLIYIEAALTLPHRERVEAYHDIADMTGRTYATVQKRAERMREEIAARAGRERRAAASLAYQAAEEAKRRLSRNWMRLESRGFRL